MSWDLRRIRTHIAANLPLASLFGIDVSAADPSAARTRLAANASVTRPGGAVAGPCLFAMADIASYALTLVLRQEDTAMTSNMLINFLRPVFDFPVVCEVVALRAGRHLLTYDVRIWSESGGPAELAAQATAIWVVAPYRADRTFDGSGHGPNGPIVFQGK